MNQRSIDALPTRLREEFEERAAMRQYAGGASRSVAEEEAYREVIDTARQRNRPVEPTRPLPTLFPNR